MIRRLRAAIRHWRGRAAIRRRLEQVRRSEI
jgi:hypothetical protein